MTQIYCGEGRFVWVVKNIFATEKGRLSFQCQPPDQFCDEREDGTQGVAVHFPAEHAEF